MRFGSFCSGVDGLALGLEAAGVGTVAWHAEVDPDASAVLAARWPGIPNYADLTTAEWERVPSVDMLIGGYPCQPFSTAGKRKGVDDERHLWPHIFAALRVLRPRLALFENVAGHVSLGLDVVLRDLAEAGFDAQWGVIRASDVGAPHQRERLFILASDADCPPGRPDASGCRPGEIQGSEVDGRSSIEPRRRHSGDQSEGAVVVAHAERERLPRVDIARIGEGLGEARCESAREDPAFAWGRWEPAIRRWERLTRPCPHPLDDRGRLGERFVEWMMGYPEGFVTDILPRTPALRCLGNSVVPQVSKWVGRQINEVAA